MQLGVDRSRQMLLNQLNAEKFNSKEQADDYIRKYLDVSDEVREWLLENLRL